MSYIENHKASGLKVGDKVRIEIPAPDYWGGWDNTWVDEMDDTVGKIGVIVEDNLKTGFMIEIEDSNTSWEYPYYVLEKVPHSTVETVPDYLL